MLKPRDCDALGLDSIINIQSYSNVFTIFTASQLKPEEIDCHVEQNRKAHRTEDYEHEQLIIRRGQEFEVTVKFNREYKPESDVVVLQFVTGLFHKPAFQSFIYVTIKTIISYRLLLMYKTRFSTYEKVTNAQN